MDVLTQIAEQRIAQAMQRGEFDNLPGKGKPLLLDQDVLVAPELRMAYRVLKNAGVLPKGVMVRREIAHLETMLASLSEGEEYTRAVRRLDFLISKLHLETGQHVDVALRGRYRTKVLERIG